MKWTWRARRVISVGLLLFVAEWCAAASANGASERKLLLGSGWDIQPSTQVRETGEALSRAEFQPKNWYPAKVPATVMAALVADRVYADPYFGVNLRSIPGTEYPIGANFSNIAMPPESPFRCAWWYRTQFNIPADYQGKEIHLHLNGINFRANVWFNGQQIANSREIAGAWRLFELDITKWAAAGAANALAIEVFPPTPHDLAITFVDWNPAPPDKGMGIWRDVYLTATGPVSIRFPQVITKLDIPSLETARLTVTAELSNSTDRSVSGVLRGQIEGLEFSQNVTLARKSSQVVMFAPDDFRQLVIEKPRLWWPAPVGPQNLYPLSLQFESGGAISDEAAIQFGIREITSELEPRAQNGVQGSDDDERPRVSRLFKINGKNILIRGGGYSFDLMLRESPEREEQELKYVRDLHLNAVRLEGKIVDDHFLEVADEYGVLVTAGWCCCDHWEQWNRWDDEDRMIAGESLKDQIRRLRSHPSVFNWMNGSDNPPPPAIEQMYAGILKQLNWPNPYESSATARPTSVTGDTGVKMTGPYAYVPPSYWLTDRERGGAYGFNTETSPGAAVPPVDSLRQMLPADHLWPVDWWWNYHAGGGAFKTIERFQKALNARYGEAANAEDFALKAQVMEYEAERAMFEAYARDKYVATGVIQWMLNNAWPSIIWHLYDYYLRPGGGYFGTKKACEPLHVQYSYDDGSVVVVNAYYKGFQGLKVSAKVLNLDLAEKFSREARVDIAADGVQKVFSIPALAGLTSTYFVRLLLEDASGKQVSSNFYWLSTKPETLDWKRSTWYFTPISSYADFTALQKLPRVKLLVSAASKASRSDESTMVTVENSSRDLAFFVHLKVMKPARDPEGEEPDHMAEVLPVLWEDNYFPLMAGEKRQIRAVYKAGAKTEATVVQVDGWNVIPNSATASLE